MRINLSFKKREKYLYDIISSQRAPCAFIKDAVEFYLKYKEAQFTTTTTPQLQKDPKFTNQEENDNDNTIEESALNDLLNFK